MDQQTQQQQLLSMNQKIRELQRLMSVNQGLMSTMAANQSLMNSTIQSLMSTMNQINLQPQIKNEQPSMMNHFTISTVGTNPSLPPHQQPEQPPQPLPQQPLLSQQQPTVIYPPDQLQQQQLMLLNRWTLYKQQQQQSMSFLQQQQQQQRLSSTSQNLTEQQLTREQLISQQMVNRQRHIGSLNQSSRLNLLEPRQQLGFLNMNQTLKQQQQSVNDNPGAGMPSSSLLNTNLLSMHTRSNSVTETVNNAEEREQQKSSIVPGGTGVGNKVNSGGGGGNSFWNLDLIKIDPKNLSLKELADLKTRMENELGDIRRMMSCLEISRKGGKVINDESKNVIKTCGEEAHSVKDSNMDLDAENLQEGDDSPIAAGFKGAGKKVELHVEGKVENKDADMDVERERGKDDNDEGLEANNDDVDAHVEVNDNGDAELNEYVMVGGYCSCQLADLRPR